MRAAVWVAATVSVGALTIFAATRALWRFRCLRRVRGAVLAWPSQLRLQRARADVATSEDALVSLQELSRVAQPQIFGQLVF